MVRKKKPASNPGSPSTPPSPPPEPPRPATPETIAEVVRRVEVLISAIREYEQLAELSQRAPRVSGAIALAQAAGAAQVVEDILHQLGWSPSSPFLYGPLGTVQGEQPIAVFRALGLLYETMSAARLARHADTFAERQRILADWGQRHSGGWDLVQGEPLPQLWQLQSTLGAIVRRLREAIGQHEEAAPAISTPVELPPSPEAFKPNRKQREILKLVRSKPMKGDRIARAVGLDYDYCRKLLAALVNHNYLENNDEGYKTIRTR